MILGNKDLYKKSIVSKSSVSSNVCTVNEDRSLFCESLDMIIENNTYINNTFKELYSKALLSESAQRLKYLSEFSFIELIENIINFFIETIQTLFGRFKSLCQRIIYSDSTIEKYADKIKAMKGEFTISFSRYIYTCSDNNIPSIDLKNTFYSDYSILEEKLNKIAELQTKAERSSAMRAIEADIKSDASPAYYDMLRAKTIGKQGFISSSEYSTELFNFFRDGGEYTTAKIDNAEITNIYNRYSCHKDLIKHAEKAKNETIGAAKEIKKKIESITLQKTNKYYVAYDTEEEVLFNNIIKAKNTQVSEACNIFVMAFSAKLDALKESAIQDKKILFEAIRYINVGGI